MNIGKVIQKQTLTFLSSRNSVLLIFIGIVVIIVSAFQFGELTMEWSRDQYSQLFNIYHDNIAGEAFQNRMCLPMPIDAVYTWVNGSDPELIEDLMRYKGTFETPHDEANRTDSDLCKLDHCVSYTHLVIDGSLSANVSLGALKGLFPEYNGALSMFNLSGKAGADISPEMPASEQHVMLVEFKTPEEVAKAVDAHPVIHVGMKNLTASRGFLTTDQSHQKLLKLNNVVMVTGLGKEATEDEVRLKIPEAQREFVSKIDLRIASSLAILTVSDKGDISTIITEGQKVDADSDIKFSAAFLVWNLEMEFDGDMSPNRFEDNEALKYSLRSLEKHAPWIRHVYIVTNGQIPAWLNLDSPRLSLVSHSDIFLNQSHLPTFSSPAIESHIHRIQGLSDKFIYLNDDTLFGKDVWPDDFYTHAGGQKVYLTWPVPNCAEGCPSSWILDNYCDKACNTSECDWDGGDCAGAAAPGPVAGAGGANDYNTDSLYCSNGCANSWVADKYCDTACNNLDCGYDAGDCGKANFHHLHSEKITGPTNITLPRGLQVAFFNVTSIFGKKGSIEEGHYQPDDVIRAATISQVFKTVHLLLHKNYTYRTVDLRISGKNEDGELAEVNITVNVDTVPVKETAVGLPLQDIIGNKTARVNVTEPPYHFPEVPEGDRKPLIGEILAARAAEVPVIADEFLNEEMKRKLAELDKLLEDGDITEKGYKSEKRQLLAEYIESTEFDKQRKLAAAPRLEGAVQEDLQRAPSLNKAKPELNDQQLALLAQRRAEQHQRLERQINEGRQADAGDQGPQIPVQAGIDQGQAGLGQGVILEQGLNPGQGGDLAGQGLKQFNQELFEEVANNVNQAFNPVNQGLGRIDQGQLPNGQGQQMVGQGQYIQGQPPGNVQQLHQGLELQVGQQQVPGGDQVPLQGGQQVNNLNLVAPGQPLVFQQNVANQQQLNQVPNSQQGQVAMQAGQQQQVPGGNQVQRQGVQQVNNPDLVAPGQPPVFRQGIAGQQQLNQAPNIQQGQAAMQAGQQQQVPGGGQVPLQGVQQVNNPNLVAPGQPLVFKQDIANQQQLNQKPNQQVPLQGGQHIPGGDQVPKQGFQQVNQNLVPPGQLPGQQVVGQQGNQPLEMNQGQLAQQADAQQMVPQQGGKDQRWGPIRLEGQQQQAPVVGEHQVARETERRVQPEGQENQRVQQVPQFEAKKLDREVQDKIDQLGVRGGAGRPNLEQQDAGEGLGGLNGGEDRVKKGENEENADTGNEKRMGKGVQGETGKRPQDGKMEDLENGALERKEAGEKDQQLEGEETHLMGEGDGGVRLEVNRRRLLSLGKYQRKRDLPDGISKRSITGKNTDTYGEMKEEIFRGGIRPKQGKSSMVAMKIADGAEISKEEKLKILRAKSDEVRGEGGKDRQVEELEEKNRDGVSDDAKRGTNGVEPMVAIMDGEEMLRVNEKYSRENSFLPWERGDHYSNQSHPRQESGITDYAVLKHKSRKLLDTYGTSLKYVNKLFNKRFGFVARKVPAHMVHMVDVNIMNQLQEEFPEEFDLTSSHRLRHGKDMQFSFSYMYYMMSTPKEVNASGVFAEFDTDRSGILSDREIRTLATRLYDLPLDLQTLSGLEQMIINCSKYYEDTTEVDQETIEEYYIKEMPQVTKKLILNCGPVIQKMQASVEGQTKYKYETMGEEEITFKMIRTNVSHVIGQLDDVRKNPKKFVCLNDNINHNAEGAKMVKAVLLDFYEAMFPIPSQFELPREYRNRFLHIDELKDWRVYRDWLRFWTHISLGALVLFSIATFCSNQLVSCRRRCCGRRGRRVCGDISERVFHV